MITLQHGQASLDGGGEFHQMRCVVAATSPPIAAWCCTAAPLCASPASSAPSRIAARLVMIAHHFMHLLVFWLLALMCFGKSACVPVTRHATAGCQGHGADTLSALHRRLSSRLSDLSCTHQDSIAT